METNNAPAPTGLKGRLKNMALFFAAPFITLLYAVMMPMAGLRLLRAERDKASKPAARP
ncbi:hypothetical protein [Ideonella sp. A 288]|uniref:hypothetical protein n=1 Tax=Ideonella sp. A 288 TaxID=1962181 RepID=UPI001303B28A|nr:hypothetical protein [Ideonella sp. A 288]